MTSDGENGAWRKSGSVFLLHGLLKDEGENILQRNTLFLKIPIPCTVTFGQLC